MGTLAILFVYCSHLMPDTDKTSQCMVELHICAYNAAMDYPNRSFEDRLDNCAESIGFELKEARRE